MIVKIQTNGVTLAGNGKGYLNHAAGIIVLSKPVMDSLSKIGSVSFDDATGVVGKDGKTKFFNATADLQTAISFADKMRLAAELGVQVSL